jgi:hypothetical protein
VHAWGAPVSLPCGLKGGWTALAVRGLHPTVGVVPVAPAVLLAENSRHLI